MTSSRTYAWLTSLAIAFAIAGCGYNDKVTAVGPTRLAQVMVVLASPDTPTTAAFLDGVSADSALSYLNSSPYLVTSQANTRLQLFYLDNKNPPDRFTALDTTVPVSRGGSYTIFAADSLSRLSPVVFQDDLSLPPSGKARVRFVHCLPGQGNVDFAVTGGAILAAGVPFKGAADWQLMNAGSYALEVRPAGDPADPIATITGLVLGAGHVYTVWLYGPVATNAPTSPGFAMITHF
jgi:hypothetical protein